MTTLIAKWGRGIYWGKAKPKSKNKIFFKFDFLIKFNISTASNSPNSSYLPLLGTHSVNFFSKCTVKTSLRSQLPSLYFLFSSNISLLLNHTALLWSGNAVHCWSCNVNKPLETVLHCNLHCNPWSSKIKYEKGLRGLRGFRGKQRKEMWECF